VDSVTYKVDELLDVITSGAILNLSLKSTDILSDYLTLALNSPIVRLQAKRDAGGSIIHNRNLLSLINRTSDGSMLSSENRLGVPLYRLSNEATKSPQRKTGRLYPFLHCRKTVSSILYG